MIIEDELSDLLHDLYRRKSKRSESFESDDTFASFNSFHHCRIEKLYEVSELQSKSICELRKILLELHKTVTQTSEILMKCLKRRERFRTVVQKNYDITTAILQAYSPKRRIDTKMKFSLSPLQNNDMSYNQWLRALKSAIRMPDGIPTGFRQQIWINLADHYITTLNVDWVNIKMVCFNEATNPDDYELDAQIIKDLHRTNTSGVSGSSLSEDERVMLKRVLLAFARWNKKIGYCQGLNLIAALLLEVMEFNEEHALKVMIYLVDYMLPPRYYTSNLSSLTIDMSVFSQLLESHLPNLATHLEKLRKNVAKYDIYEPPLTNLFTMQWFLTLFATWFPKPTVLKIWDCLLVYGSEVLLRAALIFWQKIHPMLTQAQNPDQFYSTMDDIAKKCTADQIISGQELLYGIYTLGPFPSKIIQELRDKFTYNISPFNNPSAKRSDKNNLKIFELAIPDFIKFSSKKSPSYPTCCQINSGKLHDCTRKSTETEININNPNDLCNKAMLARGNLCDIKALRAQYKAVCQNHGKSLLIISAFPNAQVPAQKRTQFSTQAPTEEIRHYYEDAIINHLYIKPGPRAKHKKNRKSIVYSS